MTDHHVSRRRLLVGGAAATAAIALAKRLPADAADEAEAIVAGSISGLGESDSVHIDSVDHGGIEVALAPGAELWKDKEVTLSAFELGDEVAAHGTWQEDSFLANRLEPLYRDLEGSIMSVNLPQVVTSAGVVTMIQETQAVDSGDLVAVDPQELRPPDVISVLGRRDPSNEALIALRYGQLDGDEAEG